MTVQELINELLKVEDKELVVRHRICSGTYGTELVWEITEEMVQISKIETLALVIS